MVRSRRGRRWAMATLAAVAVALTGLPRPAAGMALPDLAGHWAEGPVRRLAAEGLVQGRPDGRFYPDAPLTRAEFLALLDRALAKLPEATGGPAAPGTGAGAGAAPLAGVPAGHWAAPAVGRLLGRGILRPEDYPGGIALDKPITRREVARLVVRAMGLEAEARGGRGVNLLLTDIARDPEARVITTAVAHGYLGGYPDGRFGPGDPLTRAQGAAVVLRLLDPAERTALWREQYQYRVGSANVDVNVIRVNLRNPGLRPQVVTAAGGIGQVEDPVAMARRVGALAAINGTYLNAYTPQPPRDPYGTIIQGGRVLHRGADRAAIGFWPDGRARIGFTSPAIRGGTYPRSWWAYGLNHTGTEWGENWIVVHTPDRGPDLGYNAGTSVVVENGVITRIVPGNVAIPRNGFVVSLGGTHVQEFLSRFSVGDPLDFRVELEPEWEGVSELLQAGPRLLAEGQVAVDFAREGFVEEKITSQAANRSAVGLTRDGYLLLVTASAVRVVDLAEILRDLGAWEAMCMDSGASSALYYRGEVITRPGRAISNILAIVPR